MGYWEREHLLRTADVTIVGAGIVGMSTALHLRSQMPDAFIRIVERHPIAAGGSSRNAGFACFGSAGEWLDDLDTLGDQVLANLVRGRARGLGDLIDLLGESALGLQWSGGWELFRKEEQSLYEAAMEVLPRLNALLTPVLSNALHGLHSAHADQPALRHDPERANALGAAGTLHLPWEGMLHTGQMVSAFHRALDRAGVQRLHGIQVQGWTRAPGGDGWTLQTNLGQLPTTQLALCTNGFTEQLLPGLDVSAAPNRVLVLKSDADVLPQGTYHLDRGYLYMRTLRPGEILFGGGRHWGHELHQGDPDDTSAEWDAQLISAAREWLPGRLEVTHRWTGWLGVGQTRAPLIGTADVGLHYAVRMGGMGVAIGAGVGRELAQRIFQA